MTEQLAIRYLFRLLWRWKYIVIIGCVVGGSLGVAVALLSEKKYEVSTVAVIADVEGAGGLSGLAGLAGLAGVSLPSLGGNRNVVLELLQSRGFCLDFAERQDLVHELFWKDWDEETGTWRIAEADERPTLDDACREFRDSIMKLDVDELTGVVTLTVTWRDSELASAWANAYFEHANEILQQKTIRDAEAALALLRKELETTATVEIRNAIGNLVEQHLGKMVVARGTPAFALDIVDRARPKLPQDSDWPNKKLIAVIGFLLGLGAALAAIVVLDSIKEAIEIEESV